MLHPVSLLGPQVDRAVSTAQEGAHMQAPGRMDHGVKLQATLGSTGTLTATVERGTLAAAVQGAVVVRSRVGVVERVAVEAC